MIGAAPGGGVPDRASMNLGELVGAPRELDVAVGDRALYVGPPADGHGVPADRDVRVVVRRLGRLREPVHERDRLGEVLEAVAALERAAHLVPAGWVAVGADDLHDAKP